MSLEQARVRGVSVHYGPRNRGGYQGETGYTAGLKEYVINYNGLHEGLTLPADLTPVSEAITINGGSAIWEVITTNLYVTASVVTALAYPSDGGAAIDISLTDGTALNAVLLPVVVGETSAGGRGFYTLEVIVNATLPDPGAVIVMSEERSV